MKTNTNETTGPNAIRCEEPTHDEIALAAFLAWERDGRQPGRETDYWLQAENQLRIARLKKAEAAAAQAALPWPRPSRATQVKKSPADATPKLTTSVKRSTAPKSPARASGRK